MVIVACVKAVLDDKDIQVLSDQSLDYSKAQSVISEYDLNALEVAVRLSAAQGDSCVIAVGIGPEFIDDSKLKKSILARGADKLIMIKCANAVQMDAFATADVLAQALADAGSHDVILCGDGSSDEYAQQVDVQLAAKLGIPIINAAISIEVDGGSAIIKRALESSVQTVRVKLPVVVSVTPDSASPRIPGMKDILAAGKKPMMVTAIDTIPAETTEIAHCLAPQQVARRLEVLDAAEDGGIEKFISALKAAL